MFSIEILLLFMNFQSVLTVEIIANFLFLFLFTLELYFVFELKIYRRFKLFIVPYIYDIRRKYRGRHLLPIFTYLIIVIFMEINSCFFVCYGLAGSETAQSILAYQERSFHCFLGKVKSILPFYYFVLVFFFNGTMALIMG